VAEELWKAQRKYCGLKDPRGMRWPPRVLRWCLLFYTRCNSAAWDELANILHLPSGRTLQGYRNNNLTRGICEETIARYAKKQEIVFESEVRELQSMQASETARISETAGQIDARHEKELLHLKEKQAWAMKGTLAFDSMKIRQQFLWNAKEKLVEGFEGDFEGAAVAEMSIARMLEQREQTIATELMVFWFTSFGERKLAFPVGHWGISKPTYTNVHLLWEKAYNALFNRGYEVILSVCDGASENRKFIQSKVKRSSGSLQGIGIDIKDHFISALTDEPVYFITCQTHLLKKLRNNLYRSDVDPKVNPNTGRRKNTRLLRDWNTTDKKWQQMRWSTLQELWVCSSHPPYHHQ